MRESPKFLCSWMGATMSSVGRGHVKKGLPCQDVSDVSLDGDVVAIVLSDGAGSARHSEYGAAIVVKTVTRVLRETAPWTAPEVVKEQVLAVCLAEMTERANELDCELSELATTLAFVAVAGDVCISGNFGDGVVAAFRSDQAEVLIGPERGEFANVTVFLTSRCTTEHLRIIKKPLDDYDGFAVMSDSAADTLYQGNYIPYLTLVPVGDMED